MFGDFSIISLMALEMRNVPAFLAQPSGKTSLHSWIMSVPDSASGNNFAIAGDVGVLNDAVACRLLSASKRAKDQQTAGKPGRK